MISGLPRRKWTRDVPQFSVSPNKCAAEFNDVLPLFRAFVCLGKPSSYDKFLDRDGLHPNKVGSELIVALISLSLSLSTTAIG